MQFNNYKKYFVSSVNNLYLLLSLPLLILSLYNVYSFKITQEQIVMNPNMEQLESVLRSTIEEHPTLTSGYTLLAEHYLSQGKTSLARRVIYEGLHIHPNSAELIELSLRF